MTESTANGANKPAGTGQTLSGLRGPAQGGGNSTTGNVATPPTAHAYDAPLLSAKEFLLAVIHAPNLPLATRMDAANKLMHIVYIDGDYVPGEWCNKEPSLTIKIGGISVK